MAYNAPTPPPNATLAARSARSARRNPATCKTAQTETSWDATYGVPTRVDPTFGVRVPLTCPDVPAAFLDPRATWAEPAAYDRAAARLTRMFADNFAAYADGVSEAVRAAGPRVG